MKQKTKITIRDRNYIVLTTEKTTLLLAADQTPIAALDTADTDDNALLQHKYWVEKLLNEQPVFVMDIVTRKNTLL